MPKLFCGQLQVDNQRIDACKSLIARLRDGSRTERNDTCIGGARFCHDLRLDLAIMLLTKLLVQFCETQTALELDTAIDVPKGPLKLIRNQLADGRFSAGTVSDKDDFHGPIVKWSL